MIQLTRLDGTALVLNAECIQSIENTPDTLITLTTGFKLMVREKVDDVVKRFLDYKRTSILERVITDSGEENA